MLRQLENTIVELHVSGFDEGKLLLVERVSDGFMKGKTIGHVVNDEKGLIVYYYGVTAFINLNTVTRIYLEKDIPMKEIRTNFVLADRALLRLEKNE
jgi:hypothetical protein